MKNRKILSFLIYTFLISNQIFACTIFCAVDDNGHIWAGNNEDDLFNFNTYINVFPKQIGLKYGYYTLSVGNIENGSNSNAQGGMNEAGLFFDMNSLDASGNEYPIKDLERKKSFPEGDKGIYKHILGNFDKVEEVVKFFQEYWFDFGFNAVQMHFADRYGGFAMIGPSGSRILKNKKYQISTNFSICSNDPTFGCWRYPIAKQKLEEQKIGLETFVDICESTARYDNVTTLYSSVSNLNTGEIWFYYALDYEAPFKTSISELLQKGKKSYQIRDLYENNALSNIYKSFIFKGGLSAYTEFNNSKITDKQRQGILAIFSNRIVNDRHNLEAYPFLKEYVKIDSLNRYLQIKDAIWKLHNSGKNDAIKVINNYKEKVPDTGMEVKRIVNRLNGNFDEEPNATFELNGYQDAKFVFIKGLSNDVGNFLFKRDGKWIGKFRLYDGIYNYSFIVDGKQVLDSKTPINTIYNPVFPGSKPFRTHQSVVNMTSEVYETTIRVKTPDKNDVVHITGNQRNLTNWTSLIKMKKISDYEREITLDLHYPAQIKFTRGTWVSEAIIKGNETISKNGFYKPILIELNHAELFFEIINWKDKLIND
ncbi:hypothetical protein [Winogradskyella sp. R77965]|uniref:hypothetical protein n=1 Tax=Winogradskyella sp. R77965 TaxID=3093872 RepID=UPI0037DC9E78